ncbi:MAG: acyl-CoA reductase [Candidatus Izemoplasmataceae bacterium]
MILYDGLIYDDKLQAELLSRLESDCLNTLNQEETLKSSTVIDACDRLSKKIDAGDFDDLINPLLETYDIPKSQFNQYVSMFNKASLEEKMKIELGSDYQSLSNLDNDNKRSLEPLGILFHIAAGNLDILPAYSVIEGLLVGNINVLKLPSGDQGVSVKLLKALIDIEPKLKPYIYVFDVSSVEVKPLKQLANIADAIVVWGGDEAITAARNLATANTKIIEWGHKLSFAYATIDASDQDLKDLSYNIITTNQLLCSSAQGIYVNTSDFEELNQFAKRFFEVFKEVNKTHKPVPFGMHAKNAVELYYESMIKNETNHGIYKDKDVSVITKNEPTLELSLLYRNVWVKPLPIEKIISVLKPYKAYLQTASILASKKSYDVIALKLKKAGVVRIKEPSKMSASIRGESHDGMYPLRLYTKIVEYYERTFYE